MDIWHTASAVLLHRHIYTYVSIYGFITLFNDLWELENLFTVALLQGRYYLSMLDYIYEWLNKICVLCIVYWQTRINDLF